MTAEPQSDPRATTDTHTQNVVMLLKAALGSHDPTQRAQYLVQAQQQLGWAQRHVISECQQEHVPWRQLGTLLGVAHDALYRQYAAGGPVVAVSPFYRRDSRNAQAVSQLAVAFRTMDDGELHLRQEADVRGLDSFRLPFNPAQPSPYAGRELQYYYRTAPDLTVADLGRSAGYTLRSTQLGVVVCLTEKVLDELFGPPLLQSPERQRWEAALRARSEAQLVSDRSL